MYLPQPHSAKSVIRLSEVALTAVLPGLGEATPDLAQMTKLAAVTKAGLLGLILQILRTFSVPCPRNNFSTRCVSCASPRRTSKSTLHEIAMPRDVVAHNPEVSYGLDPQRNSRHATRGFMNDCTPQRITLQ